MGTDFGIGRGFYVGAGRMLKLWQAKKFTTKCKNIYFLEIYVIHRKIGAVHRWILHMKWRDSSYFALAANCGLTERTIFLELKEAAIISKAREQQCPGLPSNFVHLCTHYTLEGRVTDCTLNNRVIRNVNIMKFSFLACLQLWYYFRRAATSLPKVQTLPLIFYQRYHCTCGCTLHFQTIVACTNCLLPGLKGT